MANVEVNKITFVLIVVVNLSMSIVHLKAIQKKLNKVACALILTVWDLEQLNAIKAFIIQLLELLENKG
ncbi:hypothetical protein ASL19_09655 [Cylindrospermopsis sp. CR12]|nr:hypothetical protein ASL19_09655 [Cylindrospermopsis sp. CR12]